MLLIIAGIAAVIYGSFQYYQEKAGVMESQRDAKQPGFTGSSLDSPGSTAVNLSQNSRINGKCINAGYVGVIARDFRVNCSAIDEQDVAASESDDGISAVCTAGYV